VYSPSVGVKINGCWEISGAAKILHMDSFWMSCDLLGYIMMFVSLKH
jgi:hypothetical protein